MIYALLQKTLDVPETERLKRAFQSVAALTATDAAAAANDAYGVLVKHLSYEDAQVLQGALRSEGIDTELLAQDQLPQLPEAKLVRRIDCTPEALQVYDPLGRSFPVEWSQLLLVSAGGVKVFEPRAGKQTHGVHFTFSAEDTPGHHSGAARAVRQTMDLHLMLEIVLDRCAMRYSVNADEFNYAGLGDRKTTDTLANFAMVVQDLMEFAPHAICTRGAHCLKGEAPELFLYPTKNAFQEEIIWLLWRLSRKGSAS